MFWCSKHFKRAACTCRKTRNRRRPTHPLVYLCLRVLRCSFGLCFGYLRFGGEKVGGKKKVHQSLLKDAAHITTLK